MYLEYNASDGSDNAFDSLRKYLAQKAFNIL